MQNAAFRGAKGGVLKTALFKCWRQAMKNVIKNSRAVFYFRPFSGSYLMKSCYGRLIGTDGKFMATVSDADIVSALKENLESGFRLLMARYREPVYWHIRRLVVSHDDAQDAAQETFIRAFRSLGRFKGECSLGAWIYRIATNEALRAIERRRGGRVSLDDADAGAGRLAADGYVDYSDLEAVKLQNAILSLPTKQQLAFNLRYYDGLEYDEIAAVTGSTAASAKANYHVAKEKIIKYMNSTI